jgi:Lrp/AsnC family leucine-responsive transcriptional regulator
MSERSFGSKAPRPNHLQSSKEVLDARNLEILRHLQGDPRLPVSELARRVGMSPPAVKERLGRLQRAGVISRWRLELDPVALGFPVLAFVRVRPLPGQLPKVAELAHRLPQVVECHRTTGEDCFVMKVYFAAMEELDQVLDQFLAHGQTTTSIVQSTPVPPRELPLPGRPRFRSRSLR